MKTFWHLGLVTLILLNSFNSWSFDCKDFGKADETHAAFKKRLAAFKIDNPNGLHNLEEFGYKMISEVNHEPYIYKNERTGSVITVEGNVREFRNFTPSELTDLRTAIETGGNLHIKNTGQYKVDPKLKFEFGATLNQLDALRLYKS